MQKDSKKANLQSERPEKTFHAIDHAHEQNNKTVKGDGGVIRLTENSTQLLKWMISSPEVARLMNEFQDDIDIVKGRELEYQDNRL